MIEYLSALKTAVDTLAAALKLKKETPNRLTFEKVIAPAYQDMSKIVTDYLMMFERLRVGLDQLDKDASDKFRSDRVVLSALRREMRGLAFAVADRPDLRDFQVFFSLASDVFGDDRYPSLTVRLEHALSQGRGLDPVLIMNIKFKVEDAWGLLSQEYARLKLDYGS